MIMATPKGKIRQFFKTVRTKERKKKHECPYCKWGASLNVTQMKKYLKKECINTPDSTLIKLERPNPQTQKVCINELFRNLDPPPSNGHDLRGKKRQTSLTDDDDEVVIGKGTQTSN